MSDIEKKARELLKAECPDIRDEAFEYGSMMTVINLHAVMRALRAALKLRWQPIETAPRDGTRLLLFGDGDMVAAYFNVGYATWDDGDHHDDIQGLTHWQPLPAAPEISR
ncbi:uncharacterized protein DUF551 [Stenotrophomonas rhizophila]|uniref:Uncharacterized protein DUF551 n=1 Tax=Stenotrophomonas rhizophila TaxID=216778 RepID=A0A498CQS3_9GAMM|nr:DUF551 domain-containing protein [Stenotrophomonas rhizophila]RLK56255.1 uncharacterized protein DUF551 [Stenotrophomonas rhizophila]